MTRAAGRRTLLGAGLGLGGFGLRLWPRSAAVGVGMAASLPRPANAQAPARVSSVGYLSGSSQVAVAHLVAAFRQGLRDFGYEEGRNIVVEYRFADGRGERLAPLAAELVRRRVDLIVAAPTPSAVAAREATRSIPIVVFSVADPVRLGLAASLARPGGNLTGISFGVGLDSITKGLQLLREALPGARRVAILSNPGNPAQSVAIDDLTTVAASLGLKLRVLQVRTADDFDSAFATMAREQVAALLVIAEGLFIRQRERLAELALAHRMPTMHGVRENVEAGGLFGYGPSLRAQARRAAVFVHKILQGAQPGELPIEQPTTFELVVNLRTAKALGITIPQALLLRADEVIE